jgi:hypothetical protein
LIVRKTLRCITCESIVITRTQLGHKLLQEHAFPCPNCGVAISFVLDLDQKKAGWSYRKPTNADWVANEREKEAIKTITFSDEIPIPLGKDDRFSPFIATFGNFKNWEQYRLDEGLRQLWVAKAWPYCERCMIHFERKQWDLFDKESSPSAGEVPDPATRLVRLYTAIDAGFSKFTLNTMAQQTRVLQRVTLARAIAPKLFSRLAYEYLGSGRIFRLWNEIRNVRHAFVDDYSGLQPTLQTLYWEKGQQDSDSYKLSDNRFDDLRQLYIDCFETLCRLLVISLGLEVIIHEGQLHIPTKKGTMSLADFEALPNANKLGFLEKYPIQDLFLPVLDTKLRNGIGHNSAHYNVGSHEIFLYDSKGRDTVSNKLGYTDFCLRVLRLFAAFELATMYHHKLHLFVGGKLE